MIKRGEKSSKGKGLRKKEKRYGKEKKRRFGSVDPPR
jgi:hypothetical protein